MDELEKALNGPVADSYIDEDFTEEDKKAEPISESTEAIVTETTEEKPKRKRASRKSKKAEEKPKRKRASRKSKKSDEVVESTAEAASNETIEVPVIKDNTAEETVPVATEKTQIVENSEEPRFIRAMKNLASHQMVVEDDGNRIDNVYGDLKELLVIADGVAPSTNDFSSHLVKFSKAVAKKYGFTKIYFFEDLPLDNPEFIYGFESFGNFRNVLYACNKPDAEKISENQKELINAAGITLPASSKIHSVKEKLSDVEMQYPVKILVQDNYIEGLLYCAEKYREKNGIK